MWRIFNSILILISLIIFWNGLGRADPITVNATGAEIEVSYKEPSTNKNGSAIQDLAKTTVYYDKGQGPVHAVDVEASQETGGGPINITFITPIEENEEADVSIWATATDKSGNESDKSNIEMIRIDFLKPSPPD
jgi:hypothetical protein